MAKKAEAKKGKTAKSKVAEVEVKEVPSEVKTTEESKVKTSEESDENLQITIEKRLNALYNLQTIDSSIDKMRIVRGELPLEVQDLEDEIAGLETRIENFISETQELKDSISEKENTIASSKVMIKKYEDQQSNVRNNREYDSLTKEVEYQNLEIQLSEKRIKESTYKLESIQEDITKSQDYLTERKDDLDIKNSELKDIIAETEKEEGLLSKRSEENKKFIEDRLLIAYTRIRTNARNGLAVVQIERDACGGCFNKIPPQHQLDIRMHKKIIVCEYCGRILVDEAIAESVSE